MKKFLLKLARESRKYTTCVPVVAAAYLVVTIGAGIWGIVSAFLK